MTTKAILEELDQNYPGTLTCDGFDDAIIGIAERACKDDVVAYDYRKCIDILVERDGMSEEDAAEFLSFNTMGAWVGEHTPVFIHNWRTK